MKPSLVLLASLTEGSGNKTTAERICGYLQENLNVHLLSHTAFETCQQLRDYIVRHEIKAVLALHLFRTGNLLIDCGVPYSIIFGGTDINMPNREHSIAITQHALVQAKHLIAFTQDMKSKALALWPELKPERILVQSQGVITARTSLYSFEQLFAEQSQIATEVARERVHKKVFLLVCGIRPVKDPIYLIDAFADWHVNDRNVELVIVGPVLDKNYALMCEERIKRANGVYLFSSITQPLIQSLMTQCVAVVNSSVTEGMSAVILEAMQLGVPVIARVNEGNRSVITHKHNGLLYASPEEFIVHAQSLLFDSSLRKTLVQNGSSYVKTHHENVIERSFYCTLTERLMKCT